VCIVLEKASIAKLNLTLRK